jgi:putative transposase
MGSACHLPIRRRSQHSWTTCRRDWVVYAKPPFGGPEHVLEYQARYTHRVAISNHRLLSVNESEVRFRWRQTPLFRLRDLYAAKDYACRENLDRPFRPQFELVHPFTGDMLTA